MTKRRAAPPGASCWLPPSRSISIRSTLPRSPTRTLSPKLVVLFVVQIVINCFLALLLGQHNHNHSLTSHATSTDGALDKRAPEQVGGMKLSQFRSYGLDVESDANERSREFAATFVRERNIDRDDDLLEALLRQRPRWRLNPTARWSATSSQDGGQPVVRHNRFLTIEEPTIMENSNHEGREQEDSKPESASIAEEENIRLRRDQQQQQQATKSSTVTSNLSDRQRQHIKTRLEIQRAELAYRNKLIEIRQRYLTNRAITDRAYYILLIIYAILITFGTISNSLICLTVIFKPKILSPRNLFIVNLAGSDLLLCVFTMPLTFIEVSMKIWQMGLQATSIFVSTISITAIALDRYKVIVFPTHQETASGTRGALLLLASVWIGALAISLPLFTYRTVEHHAITSPTNQSEPFNLRAPNGFAPDSGQSAHTLEYASGSTNSTGHKLGLTRATQQPASSAQNSGSSSLKQYPNQLVNSFDFCIEDWPFAHGRGIFSVVSMFLQYVLPISIVSFVYTKISRKLQKRLIRRQRLTQLECQQKRQLNLIKRTHTMLVSVSLVFGFSWLPLNLWNVASDFSAEFRQLFDDQTFRIIFAVCHLIGCSSACSNPILYGFLNENFRKELQQVYNHHARLLLRRLRRLLDWLNRCWLIRKLFTRCGIRMEMRDDEEAGADSEDDHEGETSKLAHSKSAAIKHTKLRVSESSTRFGDIESCGKFHHQPVAGPKSSYSSNFLTEDDGEEEDDYDSGSAFYSEPSASPTSDGADVLKRIPKLLRPGSAMDGGHLQNLASPNVIPLSLMNLKFDRNSDQKCTPNDSPNRINRPRAESTPCPNRKLDFHGGESVRCNLMDVFEPVDNLTSKSRCSHLNESIRRRTRNQVGQMINDCDENNDHDDGGDVGGDKSLGTTTLQMTDAKSQNRRVSYQTIISAGRDENRTIGGRAMRLCLCISSSSSTETIDGPASVAAGEHQATPNGLGPSPGVIAERSNSDARGDIGAVTSAEDRTVARGQHRMQQRRRRRRRRRQQQQQQFTRERPTQLKCECQCHKVGKLPKLADYDTRSLCELANGSETLEAKCQATTLTGRRVWLRFLGGTGAPDSCETRSLEMTSNNDNKPGLNQEGPRIRLYADHVGPVAIAGPGQAIHRSQPDLLIRLVERKAKGLSGDEACGGAVTLTMHELGEGGNGKIRNQSSVTTSDTLATGRDLHCNICKHSSVSSAPGKLLPASVMGHRRANRKRANQASRSSLLRCHKLRAADAFACRDSSSPLRPTKMAPMQSEQPRETNTTTTSMRRTRAALSSISGWINGLRRKRSGGSKHQASMRPSESVDASSSDPAMNQLTRSGDARGSSSISVSKSKTAAQESGTKSNRSMSPNSTAANQQNSPATQTNVIATRNNLHQSQAPVLAVGGCGSGNSPSNVVSQTITLDPGGAQAMRQVGTVYLSIEMDDNRKRADSIFSFDGAREKSTSVVVMMAEDDEAEASAEGRMETLRAESCLRPSCGGSDSEEADQSNSNHRTKQTRRMNAANSHNGQQETTSASDGKNEQPKRQRQLDSVDDHRESKFPRASAANEAISRDDNFIDCCPAEAQKLAGPDDIDDGEPQSKDNQRQLEPSKRIEQVEFGADANHNRGAPASRPAEVADAAIATSTPPITVRSSNSSGSVSPSALSFTSACLLSHSSSISSCTCSLTTSSFSSGQLTATNTTSATTRDSSMSISTQATLSINVSPRNSLPQHHHNQNNLQHGRHQYHFQPRARNQPPKAALEGSTVIKTGDVTTGIQGASARPESLVGYRSVSSGFSRAAPASCGRYRGQRQIELRQSRTHSATLGSELGRAARAAASAATRYKSLRPQVAFDGTPPTAASQVEDKAIRQVPIEPTTVSKTNSNHLSSSSTEGSATRSERDTKSDRAAADSVVLEPTLSTAIVLASLQIEQNRTSSSTRIEACKTKSSSSCNLAVSDELALKIEQPAARDINQED